MGIHRVLSVSMAVVLAAGIVGLSSCYRQVTAVTDGYRNIAYVIDAQHVKLTGGVSQWAAAPGSATMIWTRYFGNEVRKDLNGDGREDLAFLLTQETGGSGTFFYAVAALKTDQGYVGSQGFFLGDRISPQTTESGPGESIIVNFADRASDEPMAAKPSIGRSIRLLLNPQTMQFDEVVPELDGGTLPIDPLHGP